MRQLLQGLLLAVLTQPAAPAEPTPDPVLAERITELQTLSDSDSNAALAGIRETLAAYPAAPPAQRGELHSLACGIVINERPTEAITLAEAALQEPGLPTAVRVPLQICRGQALDWTGQPEPARAVFETALAEARAATAPLLVVESLTALAALNSYQGQYLLAANHLREAQTLLDKARAELPPAVQSDAANPAMRDLRRRQLSLWQQFGVLYVGMDDGEKAMGYFEQVLADVEAHGEIPGQITALYNIGRASEEQGKLDEAWAAQQRAYELAKNTGDTVSVAWAQRSLGGILVLQGRYREAAPYIDAALTAFEAIADTEIIAQIKYYRARVLRADGQNAAAEADLRAAIATFRQNRTLRYLDKALIELAELREQTGALAEALALRRERDDIHRKLDQQIQDKAAARLQAEFDNQAQENENQRLADLQIWQAAQLADAKTLAQQQYVIIVLAVIIGAFVVFFAVRQLGIARRMRTMALTDDLTKIPNRRSIYAWAQERWLAADTPLAIIVIDIDYFKKINDRYGHAIGDQVLQKVAQCCRDELRQLDRIGRVGGEEFMVVLPGAPLGPALEVAERLRQCVLALPAADWADGLGVSISLGVAVRQRQDSNLAALIQRADSALYRAKAGGRNRVEAADETG